MKRYRLTLICALMGSFAWGCGDDDGSADDTSSDDGAMDDADAGDDDMDDDMSDDHSMPDDDMDDDDTMSDDDMDDDVSDAGPGAKDPAEADIVEVDRFSEDAAMLMVRTEDNGLPEANEPIDFDMPPFITQGLGPDGQLVEYYNFDVKTTMPAPIYVLQREGEDSPVEGQLNIVDVIPGDEGYNDFWQVVFVTVGEDYVANTYTSLAELEAMDFAMEGTEVLVNCPVVPDGSTAEVRLGGEDAGLHSGWYKGDVVKYFTFEEAPLMGESVPLSPIYVTFNINPEEDGGGPASGFVMEDDSEQTHNLIATVPGDDGYSPLWLVNVYDNADFDDVSDLDSALEAEQLAAGVATVNCPVVSVEDDADPGMMDAGAGDAGMDAPEPKDPAEADIVEVDRFSEDAAMLMQRTESNGLPEANAPIDFDMAPFITQGLGPDGELVQYYNFDVKTTDPAPIYVLRREGEDSPVEGQLNIVDVIPGDAGYNDFWQVVFVTVGEDYVANTYTSFEELDAMGLAMEGTEVLVNCPVVPDGSTATLRLGGEDPGLHSGWYKGDVVKYFTFEEAPLMGESVPLSPIYVTFNVNPDEEGGGPASGFVTEMDSEQTHNVVATLPGDDGYSPLWFVNVYDNAAFDDVSDLQSAMDADQLAQGVASVNCPVVWVETE